jgi:hypothetical protein
LFLIVTKKNKNQFILFGNDKAAPSGMEKDVKILEIYTALRGSNNGSA